MCWQHGSPARTLCLGPRTLKCTSCSNVAVPLGRIPCMVTVVQLTCLVIHVHSTPRQGRECATEHRCPGRSVGVGPQVRGPAGARPHSWQSCRCSAAVFSRFAGDTADVTAQQYACTHRDIQRGHTRTQHARTFTHIAMRRGASGRMYACRLRLVLVSMSVRIVPSNRAKGGRPCIHGGLNFAE